jgi:hypothetical protein
MPCRGSRTGDELFQRPLIWAPSAAAQGLIKSADSRRLAHTTYIQRINTVGGLVPAAADCNAATAGTRAEVPYTADYYFWKSQAD